MHSNPFEYITLALCILNNPICQSTITLNGNHSVNISVLKCKTPGAFNANNTSLVQKWSQRLPKPCDITAPLRYGTVTLCVRMKCLPIGIAAVILPLRSPGLEKETHFFPLGSDVSRVNVLLTPSFVSRWHTIISWAHFGFGTRDS